MYDKEKIIELTNELIDELNYIGDDYLINLISDHIRSLLYIENDNFDD